MRREEGFTLVEVLIASVVGAALVATFAGALLLASTSLKASNDHFKGDDDVHRLVLGLTRDVQGATPTLISVTPAGDQLLLGVASPSAGRFLRVTYVYDPAVGEIRRTVEDGTGSSTVSLVARHLKTGVTSAIFFYCSAGAGCPRVTAQITFELRGQDVTRTIAVAPLLGTTP